MFGHRQVALALLMAGADVTKKNEKVPHFLFGFDSMFF
jgi:hypothetical protein